jgi:membrane-associated phospholipid phosphatase
VLVGLCAAWFLLFVVFHLLPAADIGFSSLFCGRTSTPSSCVGFPGRDHWLTDPFRSLFYWVPIAAALALVADIALQYGRDGWRDRARLRADAVAVAAYLIGPILLVNGLLKAYSGRPRPLDTTIFGGGMSFVAAGDFSGACLSNCSFVSGEAAAAGWLMGLVALVHARLGCVAAAILIDISIAAPFLRVVMGGHFLSDVVLGWILGAASIPAMSLIADSFAKRNSATLERIG